MKLSVALAAAALTAASANIAAAQTSKAPAYTPIPGTQQTAQLSRRHYVQCYRRAYLACAKRAGNKHYRLRYCRLKAQSRCRMLLNGGRG